MERQIGFYKNVVLIAGRMAGRVLKVGEMGGLVVIGDGLFRGNTLELGIGLGVSTGSIAVERIRQVVKNRLKD